MIKNLGIIQLIAIAIQFAKNHPMDVVKTKIMIFNLFIICPLKSLRTKFFES